MELSQILLLLGIGLTVGFLGTLIGAGGGFILVPVLLLLFPGQKPEVITSISLMIVFLNAASGSLAYAKMKRIDYRTALIFAAATIPGSVAGAYLTRLIPRSTFDLLLGLLLVVTATFLFIRPHYAYQSKASAGKGLVHREVTDYQGHRYEYAFNIWTGISISFLVGFLSSLLGIGGGIVHVPALTALLGFPIHIATATSHLILAVMALAGTIVHMLQGNLKGQWFTVLYIGIGAICGAQGGAYFSHRVKPRWITGTLAAALLLVGVRLIFM